LNVFVKPAVPLCQMPQIRLIAGVNSIRSTLNATVSNSFEQVKAVHNKRQ